MRDKMIESGFEKIENKDSYGLTWYEHAVPYFGSHLGMRFRIARNPMEDVSLKPAEEKEGATFEATIWPEPFSFENTPEEQMTREEFPFTDEGKLAMIDWLNRQYEDRYDEWEAARAKH